MIPGGTKTKLNIEQNLLHGQRNPLFEIKQSEYRQFLDFEEKLKSLDSMNLSPQTGKCMSWTTVDFRMNTVRAENVKNVKKKK